MRTGALTRIARPPALEHPQPDEDRQREEQQHDRHRGRPVLVVALELLVDVDRRDLRVEGLVAGDEDDRAELADRAAKASAPPETIAGMRLGRMMRRNVVPAPAPSDVAASSISLSSSMRTGCTERTTNGRVTKSSDIATAVFVKATLMPTGLSVP